MSRWQRGYSPCWQASPFVKVRHLNLSLVPRGTDTSVERAVRTRRPVPCLMRRTRLGGSGGREGEAGIRFVGRLPVLGRRRGEGSRARNPGSGCGHVKESRWCLKPPLRAEGHSQRDLPHARAADSVRSGPSQQGANRSGRRRRGTVGCRLGRRLHGTRFSKLNRNGRLVMKCISLWQPWASLMSVGAKKVETRSWPYRGRMPVVMAIHAAKKWNGAAADVCLGPYYREALSSFGVPAGGCAWMSDMIVARKAGWQLPFGAVVGVGLLTACRTTDSLSALLTDQERAFGDYATGRFGWTFRRMILLAEPIPVRGMQGVFEWDTPPYIDQAAQGLLAEGTHAVVSPTPAGAQSRVDANP